MFVFGHWVIKYYYLLLLAGAVYFSKILKQHVCKKLKKQFSLEEQLYSAIQKLFVSMCYVRHITTKIMISMNTF